MVRGRHLGQDPPGGPSRCRCPGAGGLGHGERRLHLVPGPPACGRGAAQSTAAPEEEIDTSAAPLRRRTRTLPGWSDLQDPRCRGGRLSAAGPAGHAWPVGRQPAADPGRLNASGSSDRAVAIRARAPITWVAIRLTAPAATVATCADGRLSTPSPSRGISGPTADAGAAEADGPSVSTRSCTSAGTKPSVRSTGSNIRGPWPRGMINVRTSSMAPSPWPRSASGSSRDQPASRAAARRVRSAAMSSQSGPCNHRFSAASRISAGSSGRCKSTSR